MTLAPVERGTLLALARRLDAALDGDTLDQALDALHRFVARQGDRYVLTHPRFAEYRLARLERDGDAAKYRAAFAAWADEALAAEDPDPYLVRHWTDHLERDRATPERYRMLCTRRWQTAWDRVGDDESGLSRDLARAFARFVAAADATPAPPLAFLGDAWVAAFRAAERRSFLERLDPLIAAPLLRHGVWSARRALSLVATTGRDAQRAAALAALVPLLPAELLREAERLLARLDTYDKHHVAPAWAVLARRIEAEDGRRAALVLARNRPPGPMRAAALLALAASADEAGERSRLAVAAAEEQAAMNPVEQSEFPAIVATVFAAPPVGDRLDAASRAAAVAATLAAHEYRGSLDDLTRDADIRGLAGTTLKHALVWSTVGDAPALIERALATLGDGEAALRGQILLDLAPFIAAGQIDAALAAIGDGDDRSHLLAALAPRMTPGQRAVHAATLGEFAARLAPDGYRPRQVASLRALVQAGFAPAILDAAVRGDPADEDAVAIAAEQAQENEVRVAIDGLLGRSGRALAPPQAALGALLARLAAFGRPQAMDALAIADALGETPLRRAAQLGVRTRADAVDPRPVVAIDEAMALPPTQRRWMLRCLDMARSTLAARDLAAGDPEEEPLEEFWRDVSVTPVSLGAQVHLSGVRIARALRRQPREAAERAGAELFEALAARDRVRFLRPMTIGELAFVMPRAAFAGLEIERLGGGSSTDRTTVFAALGARLVVLGDAEPGIQWLKKAPYRDGVAVHVLDAVRWAAPSALVPLLDFVLERLAHRDDADLALEPLASRWAELPEPVARALLDRWLAHLASSAPTEVYAQLPNFIGGLERLGGSDALSRIGDAL
jgi:hypothetical protein